MSSLEHFAARPDGIQDVYPIVPALKTGQAEQEPLTLEDFKHHHNISDDFRGFLVGPSGSGKTTLLRKLNGKGVQTFDVDVDGIKADFSAYKGDNNSRGENPRNVPQSVAASILTDSDLSAEDTGKIIEIIKGGEQLTPDLEAKIKNSNISERYQPNLIGFANSSQVEDSLAGITLAMDHDKGKWGTYYDEREQYWVNRFSTTEHEDGIHASYIAAAGSACTLPVDVVNNSRRYASWIHLVIDETEQMERAIAQMAGKPIDYKGMTPQALFDVRNKIYACLAQVQIHFSDYKDVKNADGMRDLIADQLRDASRKPFYYSEPDGHFKSQRPGTAAE